MKMMSNSPKIKNYYGWVEFLFDEEEAKPIKNCPGYFITNLGRIWSNRKKKWIKPTKDKKYYWSVTLRDQENKRIGLKVHTLVGRHFLSEYEPGLFILHKKETLLFPEINFVSNLWVGTNQDNIIDMYNKNRYTFNLEVKKKIGKYCWDILTEEEKQNRVDKLRKARRKYYYIIDGIRYESMYQASKILEIPKSTVEGRINKSSFPTWQKIKREE
jgi:hypothetical protein